MKVVLCFAKVRICKRKTKEFLAFLCFPSKIAQKRVKSNLLFVK